MAACPRGAEVVLSTGLPRGRTPQASPSPPKHAGEMGERFAATRLARSVSGPVPTLPDVHARLSHGEAGRSQRCRCNRSWKRGWDKASRQIAQRGKYRISQEQAAPEASQSVRTCIMHKSSTAAMVCLCLRTTAASLIESRVGDGSVQHRFFNQEDEIDNVDRIRANRWARPYKRRDLAVVWTGIRKESFTWSVTESCKTG